MLRFAQTLFAALLAAGSLLAQSPTQPRQLFGHLDHLVDPIAAGGHVAVERSVPVQLDLHLLHFARQGDRVRFPAFDGEVFDLELRQREEVGAVEGAFHWHVSIVSEVGGRGILTVLGDRVAGYLAPGDHRLTSIALQPAPNGMTCLRELQRPRGFCGCGGHHGAGTPPASIDDGPRALRTSTCTEDPSEITILCVYDRTAEQQAGGVNGVSVQLMNAVARTTTYMRDTGIPTSMRITTIRGANYSDSNADMDAHINRLDTKNDGYLEEVHDWRLQDLADLVTMVVGDSSAHGNTLGIANYPVSMGGFRPDRAFSVCELTALGDNTMPHEIGHNLGCAHDNSNASTPPMRPYAYGYSHRFFRRFVDHRYVVTCMSYDPTCTGLNVCTIARAEGFSTPNRVISTNRGNITIGDANHDNVRNILETRQYVANYSSRLFGVPTITQQPSNNTVCLGPQSNLQLLTVVADHANEYEWFKQDGLNWVSTGQTGASFDRLVVTAADLGVYRCRVTNCDGFDWSDTAVLDAPPPPTIDSHPTDRNVAAGPQPSRVMLTTLATGATDYLWFKQDSQGTWQELPSQYTHQLLLTDPDCDDSGTYRCRVSGCGGSVDSNPATLTVGEIGSWSSYGAGCSADGAAGGVVGQTFYELFTAFDLQNTALRFTPQGTDWRPQTCASCFDPGFANALNLGDDQLTRGHALGFTFPMPGGLSTTTIDIDSNGWVGLLTGQHAGSDFSESVGEFLANPVRIAAFWDDFDPTAAGDVYFDTAPGRALITWAGVPQYGAGDSNTFQLQLFDTGEFVLAWETVDALDALVGYSLGDGAADPGNSDLSSHGGLAPILRSADPHPTIGEPLPLAVDVAPASTLAVVNLGFAQTAIDLTGIGMGGCTLLTTPDVSLGVALNGTTGSTSLPLPGDSQLVGRSVFTQAVVLEAGVNRLGALTSNGVEVTFGSCR